MAIKDGDKQVDLGEQCDEATLRHLRTHRVSMVFQKFALMPWLTVLDNVAFGLEMQGVAKDVRRARRVNSLKWWLSGMGNEIPHELSGGMQQRVGLARAFAMNWHSIDGRTVLNDPLIRAQLQDELITLQNKLNKTILFVSHDLDEALKIGNNIAIMESGKLIQHGKPEGSLLTPKTEYVKDFVAHTNPLNVLKGRSLMQPLESQLQDNDSWRICDSKDLWVEHSEGSCL